MPPVNPGIEAENDADNATRYARIRDGLAALRRELHESRPDALILIGDDQEENFRPEHLLPQIAVYLGADFRCKNRSGGPERHCKSHPEMARSILHQAMNDGFDMGMCNGLTDGLLASHAHYEIAEHIVADSGIPVVLIFVNALHIPAVAPARCHALGESIRRAIATRPDGERYAIYASGGLSHFTGGFPWKQYTGPYAFGDISQDFDRQFMGWIERGEGERARQLTSADLLHHGDVEMRSWISLLGAVGPAITNWSVYEPFYRGMMGMAAASWKLTLDKK